ncbi:MAG: protein-L-isoaspartate(D-aspartate) O-methyltransferase [Armatimonadetes bacterium]|nr:protein-L-isoaspartate(D-aspartate) O-methyltransferase [Armatimonadota bacterium]MDW8121471.1 protein-L-isoaspartate(D-aspartate) O-methyltransferase [Armatimonadota bacterium]
MGLFSVIRVHPSDNGQRDQEESLARLRQAMVEHQIRRRGIVTERVLKAFSEVPRHKFVRPENVWQAYEDYPLAIGYGQTISQPYIVALMTDLLALKGNEKVLEIGTGSGYQAAILGRLAATVFTIERIPHLADRAAKILEQLGFKNVYVVVGDGSKGLPPYAPYDAILVTAAASDIPPPLIDQLADGGRLVLPVGDRHLQELIRVIRKGNRIVTERRGPCTFVPLVGTEKWAQWPPFPTSEEPYV